MPHNMACIAGKFKIGLDRTVREVVSSSSDRNYAGPDHEFSERRLAARRWRNCKTLFWEKHQGKPPENLQPAEAAVDLVRWRRAVRATPEQKKPTRPALRRAERPGPFSIALKETKKARAGNPGLFVARVSTGVGLPTSSRILHVKSQDRCDA